MPRLERMVAPGMLFLPNAVRSLSKQSSLFKTMTTSFIRSASVSSFFAETILSPGGRKNNAYFDIFGLFCIR